MSHIVQNTIRDPQQRVRTQERLQEGICERLESLQMHLIIWKIRVIQRDNK